MIKFIQAFTVGIFCTMVVDFFLFIGIQLHYLRPYHVDVYYNTLFLQHQNIFIFTVSSLAIGYLLFYLSNRKLKIALLSLLCFLSLLPLIPTLGEQLGRALFFKKNVSLQINDYTYHGDLYYHDKRKVYLFDTKSKSMLLFKTQKITKMSSL